MNTTSTSLTEAVRFSASPEDLKDSGKALRKRVPRVSHGEWRAPATRSNPVAVLAAGDAERLPNLVPIRYGRMLPSPFAFFRGTAGVMAADLAATPSTGVHVQACGDCHLKNFGGFASPERSIVFDINDFDETLPAPWEWDLKRLAVSFVLAARENNFSEEQARASAVACARRYRKALREYSRLTPLDLWYSRFTLEDVLAAIPDVKARERAAQRGQKALQTRSDAFYPKLAQVVAGEIHIRENPPLIYHADVQRSATFADTVEQMVNEYRQTLADDRRMLFDRYRFVDAAIKVVGVGSVGTRCWVVLLMSASNDPLFLQFKQAQPSVLEPYAGKSVYPHSGQRVVMGQRLMQAASDIFLGWVSSPNADFYVRQLRDAKVSPVVETMGKDVFAAYAKLCGQNLARAHAKTGSPVTVASYLGKSDEFDEAIGDFAMAYADQCTKDHEAFKAEVKAGRIPVYTE